MAFILVVSAAVVASLVIMPGLRGVLGGALALLMAAIVAVDARRFIIPNVYTASAFCLALVHAAVLEPDAPAVSVGIAVLRAVVLALAFYVLREIHYRIRGREGLGLGDVKLAGVAGAWLDWPMMAICIEIAAVTAIGAYLVHQAVRRRPLRATGRLPFGMFLAPAIWLTWCFDAWLMGGS